MLSIKSALRFFEATFPMLIQYFVIISIENCVICQQRVECCTKMLLIGSLKMIYYQYGHTRSMKQSKVILSACYCSGLYMVLINFERNKKVGFVSLINISRVCSPYSFDIIRKRGEIPSVVLIFNKLSSHYYSSADGPLFIFIICPTLFVRNVLEVDLVVKCTAKRNN